jgi:hypothetical protein
MNQIEIRLINITVHPQYKIWMEFDKMSLRKNMQADGILLYVT